MKLSFKFSVVMLFILTTLLSGCIVPEVWVPDGHGGEDRGGEHRDRGGDRGGDRGDHGGR
jgi:hypothetical protein